MNVAHSVIHTTVHTTAMSRFERNQRYQQVQVQVRGQQHCYTCFVVASVFYDVHDE